MPSRQAQIAAPEGLHARPAANFVQAAKACGIEITIAKGDRAPVSATSMLSVLSLGVGQGDFVTLTADGQHADEALETLVALLEKADQ